MCVIVATCVDECFLFRVITGRRYFFLNFVVTARFFQTPYCFETSVLKKVRILRYLHNNSAALVLMPSSKIKLSYTILIHTWKTFVADIFYDNVFYTLYFLTAPSLFFICEFFWKTQIISESMFLRNTVKPLEIACYLLKVSFYTKVRTKISYQHYIAWWRIF